MSADRRVLLAYAALAAAAATATVRGWGLAGDPSRPLDPAVARAHRKPAPVYSVREGSRRRGGYSGGSSSWGGSGGFSGGGFSFGK